MPREQYTSLNILPNLLASTNPVTTALLFLERQHFTTHYTNNLIFFYYTYVAVLIPILFHFFSSLISAILPLT